MGFFGALIEHPFLQLSLGVALAACISGALVGSYVVVKRISFLAGAISHTVLSGLGGCLYAQRVWGWTWADPFFGAILSAVMAASLLGWVHVHRQQREDAVIAILWAVGMAVGVIAIASTPGSNTDVMAFLFGNILWVSPSDLWLLLGLDALILLVFWWKNASLTAICFDEDQSCLQGLSVSRLYQLLLILVAITVVLLTAVVGSVLVMALLTIPSTIAGLYARSLPLLMGGAVALGCLFCVFGIGISYPLDWPPGATIALVSGLGYCLALMTPNVSRLFQKTRP
jgi:zinc transport system permease protein